MRRIEASFGIDGDFGAEEADFQIGLRRFQRFNHLYVHGEGRRGGMADDGVEILHVAHDVIEGRSMRRRIDEFPGRNHGRRLREPGWIPEGPDFAPRLIAGTGASIEPIERRGLQKENVHQVVS